MDNITEYEKEQIALLSKYHPFSFYETKTAFLRCSKSFNKTEKALEYANAYNSLEKGISEANLTTAST